MPPNIMAVQLPHLTSLATDMSDNSSSRESIAQNCNTITAASTASGTACRRPFCNRSIHKQIVSVCFCTCLQHSNQICLLFRSHDALFVCLSVCLPFCLSVCLSFCLSVCLFVCLRYLSKELRAPQLLEF